MKKLLFFFLFCSTYVIASPSALVLDRHFTPYAASQDLLLIENELIRLEDRSTDWLTSKINPAYNQDTALELTPLPRPSLARRILARTLRFSELTFFWGPLNETIHTTQHEVFGHGYRIRDLGKKTAEVVSYKIGLPFPYGDRAAYTAYNFNLDISPQDLALIAVAGTEADTIMSHNIALDWLSENKIDGREASLFLHSALQLPSYILSLKDVKETFDTYQKQEGHDVATYLMNLNSIYPSEKSFSNQLSTLREKAAYSILTNAFTYYSLFAQWRYIWTGKTTPMTLGTGPIRFFMPIYRVELSPFGPEDVVGTYLLFKSGEPTYLYYKSGSFSQNKYHGFGFENKGIFKIGSSSFGLKLDFWNQPALLHHKPVEHEVIPQLYTTSSFWKPIVAMGLSSEYEVEFDHSQNGYTNKELFSKYFGSAASLIYQYEFDGSRSNTLFTQLGYKTKGFLPGESIHAGPIIRFGMNLLF